MGDIWLQYRGVAILLHRWGQALHRWGQASKFSKRARAEKRGQAVGLLCHVGQSSDLESDLCREIVHIPRCRPPRLFTAVSHRLLLLHASLVLSFVALTDRFAALPGGLNEAYCLPFSACRARQPAMLYVSRTGLLDV